nr:armadillo repeat-containing protein 4-like [Halyomorpha halys]
MKYTFDMYQSKTPETPECIMMLKTINKCLDNERCRHYLLSNGLLEFQIKQLKTLGHRKQLKHTLACLVRFLKIKKYRMKLHKSELIPSLLQLFKHTNPLVREYSGRIVAELSRYESNHDTLVGEQNLGLTWFFDMCENLLDYDLLAHVYKIVMELSYVPTIFWWVADRLDIIPLLWAAVTNPNPKCNEYGCSALVPYIGPIPGSHDIVRRIAGGVFDLMSLTYNEDDGAKAGAITLLSRIACDTENLNILDSLGFIDRLFELSKTAVHPRLRYAIGLGFGSCGHDKKRSFELGKRGAVTILVEWLLNDNDSYVQLGVVSGLWKLSYELINCMVMIKYQIVERLLEIMACDNECLHNSVAALLTNMRRLARIAEYQKYVDEELPPEAAAGKITDVDLILPYQYPDLVEPDIHIE